jgi:hypothetical protein
MTDAYQVCRWCGATIARGQAALWRTRDLQTWCADASDHKHLPRTKRMPPAFDMHQHFKDKARGR